MRALTVHQPWAWAIISGGKDVENRSRPFRWRGPIAIHASRFWSDAGANSELVSTALREHFGGEPDLDHLPFTMGAIIGVVDLVGAHVPQGDGCCKPWGQSPGLHRVSHLVLENPRSLPLPVPVIGRQGLWRTNERVDDAIREQGIEI